jgi:hypothetical protein
MARHRLHHSRPGCAGGRADATSGRRRDFSTGNGTKSRGGERSENCGLLPALRRRAKSRDSTWSLHRRFSFAPKPISQCNAATSGPTKPPTPSRSFVRPARDLRSVQADLSQAVDLSVEPVRAIARNSLAGSRRWDSPRDALHSRVLERFANFASLFRCDAALREIVHDLFDVPLDGAGRLWLFFVGHRASSSPSSVDSSHPPSTGHRYGASHDLWPADQLKRHERDHQRQADVMLHLIEKGQRKALRRPDQGRRRYRDTPRWFG